jgi:hypothetical protein
VAPTAVSRIFYRHDFANLREDNPMTGQVIGFHRLLPPASHTMTAPLTSGWN